MPVRLTVTVLSLVLSGAAFAQQPDGARINNLKVLSSRIDDVSTVENILKSFTKPGQKEEDRARGIWTAVVKYRHQTTPPNEELAADWEAHDPVKIFNVYGYCMCCCCSALVQGLNRADGREARGRILNGHSVPETKYSDGTWHMFDGSLITFFPKPDGKSASVDEIGAAVKEWLAKNPGLRKNDKALGDFMRKNGWTGWKAGPELLNNCRFLGNDGWFPARTHGWYATMVEYDRDSEVYEYGYQLGHKAVFSLRPGESIVREGGHRGLHVDGARGPHPTMKQKAPAEDLVYLKAFMPGYNGGVIANGYQRFEPDWSGGRAALGAEVYENIQVGRGSPPVQPQQAGKPAVIVFPMSSPYVYLGGRLKLTVKRQYDTDRVAVSISTNNGRTFAPVWLCENTGLLDAVIHLDKHIHRRYSYLVKIEMTGSVGVQRFAIENDIQHAPRTIPWLAAGENTITVAADGDTGIATRTVSCRISSDAEFKKNETTATMGVTFDNLTVQDGQCWWKGGVGSMTVPIETPGDITSLRFGAQVRARGNKDVVKMLLSFDGGKTWTQGGAISGPTAGTTHYFKFDKVPAGSKKALLKYELTGNNTIGLFSFRVDADHRDPLAAKAARPFAVVHAWKEGGVAKTHRQLIDKLPLSYGIKAAGEVEMVSVTYEMSRE